MNTIIIRFILIITQVLTIYSVNEFDQQIHIFGDSNAAYCFTNLHIDKNPSDLHLLKQSNDIYEQSVFSYQHDNELRVIPFTIHWLLGRTMHRIGRDGIAGFNSTLFGVKNGDIIVFVFVMIDIMDHVYRSVTLRQMMHGRDVHEIITTLVSNYERTIVANRDLFSTITIVVMGVLPPYIGETPQVLFNTHYPHQSFLSNQVMVTNHLNHALSVMCKNNKFLFLDVNQMFQSKDGSLKKELSDGGWHIHPKYNVAIKRALIDLLDNS